jgi:hypothetical protein
MIMDRVGEDLSVDEQFLFERIFFNYSISSRTYYNEIKLMKANHSLIVGVDVVEKRVFNPVSLFSSNPRKTYKVQESIATLFIESCRKYLPKDKFALSFTSGFDGRTILAVAKSMNCDFVSYSFGKPNAIDVELPRKQAESIGIPYIPFLLDEEYIHEHSYECGLQVLHHSDGMASFARAHYLFAIKKIAQKYKYILTGNFGSELFRSIHNVGVMFSYPLFQIFDTNDLKKWHTTLIESKNGRYIQKQKKLFHVEQTIEYFNEYKKGQNGLNKNQFFYNFVLEEVFRQYFGPEVKFQCNYITNRSPFLDYHFIQELFKTDYCGPNRPYFVENPIKRFKGQVIYPQIMLQTFPAMLHLTTGKGYRPSDLLSLGGKIPIALAFFSKKVKNTIKSDDFSVMAAFLHNRLRWGSLNFLDSFYDKEKIKEDVMGPNYSNIDILINLLSCNIFLNP